VAKTQGGYVKDAKARASAIVKQDPTLNEDEVALGLLVDGIYAHSEQRLAFGNLGLSERRLVEERVRKILSEWRPAKPRRPPGTGIY
jgi:hypothetical protein